MSNKIQEELLTPEERVIYAVKTTAEKTNNFSLLRTIAKKANVTEAEVECVLNNFNAKDIEDLYYKTKKEAKAIVVKLYTAKIRDVFQALDKRGVLQT